MFNFFKFSRARKIIFIILVVLATPVFIKSGLDSYEKGTLSFLTILAYLMQYMFCTFIMSKFYSESFKSSSENNVDKK